jgi:hypothetical protein
MTEKLSRRAFIDVTLLSAVGALLAIKAASGSEEHSGSVNRESSDRRVGNIWGTYHVGEAGLGEVKGLRVVKINEGLETSILEKSEQEGIRDPKIETVEIVGDKRSVLVPFVWTTQDNQVIDRWSIWSFNEQKEIIPVDNSNNKDMVFVEMAKVDDGSTLFIGPTKGDLVERYISFVQNWGWEMYLPYKDLDKVQGPIPFKQAAQNFQEFLVK